MSITEAVFLGIIQGLTEFLPISSTGHLTLAGKLFKLISESNPEKWTAFIAVIQLGTLLAVLVYFRRDLSAIAIAFFKDNLFAPKAIGKQSPDSLWGWYLILATLPIIVIGLGFKTVIEGTFTKNLYVISGSLIIFALILALGERRGKFNRLSGELRWSDALLIGIAQSFALIPGASRSGTTITAGLLLGFNRETAARFSFLLSIPAIAASGMLQFFQSLGYLDRSLAVNVILAGLLAGIVGYLSIEFLLRYLKRQSTAIFIIYRIVLGLFMLVLLNRGVISP